MKIKIFPDKKSLGQEAAEHAAALIREAVKSCGRARIIAATGASQLEFLDALCQIADVPWDRVEMFHLDEYIGLDANHPASFRRYLTERFINRVGITEYHLLNGGGDPQSVCRAMGDLISASPVDVAFTGIGENGHLAFNDPPADFATTSPYLVARLDEACRRQQFSEGWFPDLAAVPVTAITMSIHQILQSRKILCVAPDLRKAASVKAVLEGPLTPHVPASALRNHSHATLYLDTNSASLLRSGSPAVQHILN